MAGVRERTYAADKQRVWDALKEVLNARFEMRFKARDARVRDVTINTGGSIWSFHGQDITVALNEEDDGTHVLISGDLAKRKGEKSNQLFAWGEKSRLVKKIYADLDRVLGA